MSGPRGSSPRPRRLVLVAVLWVAIDVLLIRIASGGDLTDWAHTFRETPRLFMAELTVSVIDLLVAVVVLWRPDHGVLLANAAWGLLVAVFGVVLMAANDTSASLIVVGASIAGWLAYRAAGAPAAGG